MKPFTLEWYKSLKGKCGELAYFAANSRNWYLYMKAHKLHDYINKRINNKKGEQ